MAELKPTPQCTCNGCTCGTWKAVEDLATFTQLMQFLMGLNNVFETARHQLLVMEPVPSINKAYSIIQSMEKQRRVQMEITERTGHNQSTYFKLDGTPDLYKELTDKTKKEGSGNRGVPVQTSTKEELLHELLALMRNTMQPPAQGNLA
ncbi:UNVERIFIED_CONTAM: hypothetical protein Sindi_2668700 [Sesamum indicum]